MTKLIDLKDRKILYELDRNSSQLDKKSFKTRIIYLIMRKSNHFYALFAKDLKT